MAVSCNRGCGKSWPRDPVLEVKCPTCQAGVGVKCRRPSGHDCDPHASRDILADEQGFYGECPLGLCGLQNVAARKNADDASAPDLPLFQNATPEAASGSSLGEKKNAEEGRVG